MTRTQVDEKIQDSVKQFYDDTIKSARDKARPDLIKVLTYQSASAVEWLQDVFNLDLTLVSLLGYVCSVQLWKMPCLQLISGHSQPRTHRGHDAKFPGMAITYALMQRLEELVETDPDRIRIIKKARVTKINKEENKITGVTYEFGGEESSVDGVVVLATGGYAADFGNSSLLKKHRPDTFDLASTNGTHATGDGLKMLMEIGGNGIDLDKVQVHPTGLVDPKDPGSKWKFLAAEGMSAPIKITQRLSLIDIQLYVVRVVYYSTVKVKGLQTSWVTVTMCLVRCGSRRKPRSGLFVSYSIPKHLTCSTFILVTTRAVA